MYSEILTPIVRSPKFPELLQQLQEFWENEQERRQVFYDWVTPDIKVEFIEGEIVVHSPVRSRHNVVLKNILRVIDVFVDVHDIGYVGVEKVMCRFPRNDYEPDLCFFNKETAANFTDERTIFPVPQLIVEILSASTEGRDRGVKFEDYQANGVEEYWIVNASTNTLEQYILKNNTYLLVKKHTIGDELTAYALPNFKILVDAFFDKTANLKAMKYIA